MRQAQAIKDRMCRELGHEVDVHGHRLWTFPEPSRLIRLESYQGLFGRKDVSAARLSPATSTPRRCALYLVMSRWKVCSDSPGIGEFGSQLVRLRALSAVDELPTREPRLLGAIRTEYGLDAEPNLAELEALSEKWRPFRIWAAVNLRRTLMGERG